MEYKIRKISPSCSRCASPFQDHQVITSVIAQSGKEWIRSDFCPACPLPPPEECYSLWKTRFLRDSPPVPRIRKENLYQMFRRLFEDGERPQPALVYLLGLMLLRKKVLREIPPANRPAGHLILLDPKAETRFQVPLVPIPPGEQRRLQQQLTALLTDLAGEPVRRSEENPSPSSPPPPSPGPGVEVPPPPKEQNV